MHGSPASDEVHNLCLLCTMKAPKYLIKRDAVVPTDPEHFCKFEICYLYIELSVHRHNDQLRAHFVRVNREPKKDQMQCELVLR